MNEFVMLSPEKLREIVAGAVASGVKMALSSNGAKNTYTDVEAAEYLGISRNTLRGWRVEKHGPAYHKSGKAVVYLRKDLDDWLARQKVLTIDSMECHHEKYAI